MALFTMVASTVFLVVLLLTSAKGENDTDANGKYGLQKNHVVSTKTFANDPNWILSTRVTNWGDWGPEEKCPTGTFAIAIKVKLEYEGANDNTALNGITLYCGNKGGLANGENLKIVTSRTGQWGSWSEFCNCSAAGEPITGFSLLSEPDQNANGNGDDTAANGLRIGCGASRCESAQAKWGTWQEFKSCPDGSAICGLRTQVEPPQGLFTDDTALNNVDFYCCKL